MHWQTLGVIDWIVIAAIAIALLAVIPLYRSDMRRRRRSALAWHHAYFHRGGLVRALMTRWNRGPPRLSDQRKPPTD